MPELPEVETTLRGIQAHISQQIVQRVEIRCQQLRWPIPLSLINSLPNQCLHKLSRRGKYLILSFDTGHLLIHLGMSGSMRIVKQPSTTNKHDHFELFFHPGISLKYTDPRRFGAILWTEDEPLKHRLLCSLGVEPLTSNFTANYLKSSSIHRSVAIKPLLMDSKVLVGVGNIYASESLFLAGIHPTRRCNNISLIRYQRLIDSIKEVLKKAIQSGGTSLKDFTQADGKPGYFAQNLNVYGRNNEPCYNCKHPIIKIVQSQRASFYCPKCQT